MFRRQTLIIEQGHQKVLPLVPLKDVVIFPNIVAPLYIGRSMSVKALEHAMKGQREVFLCAQKDARIEDPKAEEIYNVGTISTVLQVLRLPDGTVKILVEGKKRGKAIQFLAHNEMFLVKVIPLETTGEYTTETEALVRSIKETFQEYGKLHPKITGEVLSSIVSIEDAEKLCDTISGHLNLKLGLKQKLLEIQDLNQRCEYLFRVLVSELNILQIEERLKERVRKQMEKIQKDYYLTEQMRAIQKEMGAKDEFKADLEELEKRIKAKRLPKEAHQKVRQEFKKLKLMSPMSAEAVVVRNYIDWILSLPWYEKSKVKLNINEAENILNEDHYGLEKPKERILEYLAVNYLTKKVRGPILCLVGPPGVGKTSLAKSIARATGRNFVRLSLGGVRDEAEIRGHRRTYIGALPGKIIQLMKKAKTINPVFCLDEVDKMSSDFRGDPAAALLEVLDPEQNVAFNDHYLDLDYDLSNVFFVTTANTLSSIPLPLQDRMEIIRLPGYTEVEKLNIAKYFLVKKQLELNGLGPQNLEISDGAILGIIREYTREAGVRNLEREISSICRKVAKDIVKNGAGQTIKVTSKSLFKFLGIPRYRFGKREEKDLVGVATGLAWSEVGGELLQIEATIMPGKGELLLTGKLGDVMKESAQAALSYVRSRARQLVIPDDFYEHIDIHIHVPEGAIPKDGPSAGIALCTAIVSALTKWPVKSTVAMTGEITLRGRVLPIGGLKEKILAAHRGGIAKVLIPTENKRDLEEIPEKVLKKLEVILVDHMDEVLKHTILIPEGENIFLKEREFQPFCILDLLKSNTKEAPQITPTH